MSQRYTLNSCVNCLPFSRTKLFREIFDFRTLGDIRHIWFGPGHLFVSLSSGKKLYTFDCKTVEYIQDAEKQGCLDITDDYRILKVLWKPPNAALVVFENGVIKFWSYNPDNVWKQQTMCRLCHGHMTSLVDICFNISQNALYWCQQDVSADGKISYTICKRPIIEDVDHKDVVKLGPSTNILTQCPKSTIYPRGHGIIIVTEKVQNMAQFIIRVCTLKGTVEILVDHEWCGIQDINVHTPPLAFSQVAMKSLQYMYTLKNLSIFQTAYNGQSQTLYLLSDTGMLYIHSSTDDSSVKAVSLHDFTDDQLIGIFPQNECVGLTYQDYIKIQSVDSGELLCTVKVTDGSKIIQQGDILLGGLQQTVLTDCGFYVVQKSADIKGTSEMSLLEMCNFQSDAVRLSYIDQMQKCATMSSGTLSLDSLRDKWIKSIGTPPTSKLVEIVDPYLSQYWKLDNLLNEGFQDMNKISQLTPESVEYEVLRLVNTDSSLPISARQSQLVLLSKHFPKQVLECLLSHLSINDSEMSTSQYQKWQSALTLESPNMTGSVNSSLPIFELACHLLYLHKPERLIEFVLHGQKMWDQKVGKSAFVRRRQIPLIHERALKCFPQPEQSDDPDTAILTHVHILLISDVSNCFTKAIHLLTKAKKWTETIQLLTEYRDKCSQFSLLYQMTLAALTKNKVLDKYAEQLFALMPTFDCTNDMLQVSTKEQPGYYIFCEDSEQIAVDSVRQHFLRCMKNL